MTMALERGWRALRLLVVRPGMSVATAITLGLGIGLTTTMFSVLNGSVWRLRPIVAPGRLVHLERTFARREAADPAVPLHDFFAWRQAQTSLEALAAFYTTPFNIASPGQPAERVSGAFVTANTFPVAGVAPLVGRGFTPDDERVGAPRVALISYALWRDRFGREPDLARIALRVDGEVVPVVGVMPERFRFPYSEDVWLPLAVDPAAAREAPPWLQVIGRLKPGRSRADVQAEFATIAARLARAYPDTHDGVGVVVRPFVDKFLGEVAVQLFYAFFAASVVVLLVACTNVTNLLLAVASRRAREMAVRAALGASRGRVARQVLGEVLLLAGLGGVLGWGLAHLGVRLFNDALVHSTPPFWMDIRVDTTATLFVVALVVVLALVAGLVPALRASGARAPELLKDEARGGTGWHVGRLSRTLVMVEVALSAALLVGAGLLVQTLRNVRAVDFGFDRAPVLTGSIALPPSRYPTEDRQRAFWTELLSELERHPAVESATLTSYLPGLGSGRAAVAVEGEPYSSPRDYPLVRALTIGPGFLRTFGLRVREGRELGTAETPSSQPVALVNARFVARYLRGGPAIGRRLRVVRGNREAVVTIVGVAPDMHHGGVRNPNPEAIYLPLAQWPAPVMSLAVRTRGEPGALAAVVRNVVAARDPDLPVYDVKSMEAALLRVTWFYGTFSALLATFGAVALVLAVVGLYSLMSFSVAERTRELGVRLAMGARPADLVRHVLWQAFVQLAVGLVAGLALATWASRLLAALLYGVAPREPAVYASVAAVLVACGLLAAAVPAVRAARMNPVEALRHE
jgi:putative ABC transport system permease protein